MITLTKDGTPNFDDLLDALNVLMQTDYGQAIKLNDFIRGFHKECFRDDDKPPVETGTFIIRGAATDA